MRALSDVVSVIHDMDMCGNLYFYSFLVDIIIAFYCFRTGDVAVKHLNRQMILMSCHG